MIKCRQKKDKKHLVIRLSRNGFHLHEHVFNFDYGLLLALDCYKWVFIEIVLAREAYCKTSILALTP